MGWDEKEEDEEEQEEEQEEQEEEEGKEEAECLSWWRHKTHSRAATKNSPKMIFFIFKQSTFWKPNHAPIC